MFEALELLPNQEKISHPTFTEQEYNEFRARFMDEVIPRQEKLLEARRRSEEEARQRLLK